MAPTTRSGSKRASGEAADTNKDIKKTKRVFKTAAKPAKSEEPASEAPQYFRFLDLSPELRNRVYEYAKEDDSGRFAPQPIRHSRHTSRGPRPEPSWKFFALTHVCAQVRAEYRPLWVQDLCVAFSTTSQLADFLDTFLRFGDEQKHMPKLVQFLWDHGNDDQVRFDLTRILRLHAHSPSSQVAFVPEMVARGQTVDEEICNICMRRYHLEHSGMYPDSDDDDDTCECPDYGFSNSEWEDFKNDQMEYTSDIPTFVHNTNQAWIKAVQENKVTVTCVFCQWSHHAIFRVLYKDPVCETIADSQPALDLMKSWGIFDLPTKRGTHFVFAYEGEQITETDEYAIAHSVTRQIIFRKSPSKA